jgi:hypothetical protein
MEEQITRMPGNKVLIKIFGLQRRKVTGEWRKLCSGSFISRNLLNLLAAKPIRTWFVEQVTYMWHLSDTTRILTMSEIPGFICGDSEDWCLP